MPAPLRALLPLLLLEGAAAQGCGSDGAVNIDYSNAVTKELTIPPQTGGGGGHWVLGPVGELADGRLFNMKMERSAQIGRAGSVFQSARSGGPQTGVEGGGVASGLSSRRRLRKGVSAMLPGVEYPALVGDSSSSAAASSSKGGGSRSASKHTERARRPFRQRTRAGWQPASSV